MTSAAHPANEPLAGYRHPKPMVFSGLYPMDGDDYPDLRDALDKLRLNDAALVYEPETSLRARVRLPLRLPRPAAHGDRPRAPGARVRPVPDLHRAERRLPRRHGHRPGDPGDEPERLPGGVEPGKGKIDRVYEPVVRATVISPSDYIGTIMELCQSRRGALLGMDYLSADRVEIRYTLPLAEIIFDFFDQLKSRTRGYASLDYEPDGEQQADLVKVDILLQGEPVDAFSQIVHDDKAREYGLSMTAKLKELIPRQQFEVPIQAAIGARIIARENIRAHAQGRAGQVLRRRHHPQAQAAGEAEGGQEADEDDRARRRAAGGLRRGPVHPAAATRSPDKTKFLPNEAGACPTPPLGRWKWAGPTPNCWKGVLRRKACWNPGPAGPACWNGSGWACAVAMAVTSAASVKITSAVMTRAAADCQLAAGSAPGGTAGFPAATARPGGRRVGERPGGRSAVSVQRSPYVRAA